MQVLIDHIAGVIIGGTVILLILAAQLKGSRASIESTQYYATKKGLFSLVESIERDFSNIGSGVPFGGVVIDTLDTLGTVKAFAFRARSSQGDPAPHLFRYEWTEDGTEYLADGPTPTYKVERKIDGAVTGQSSGMVISMRIDLLKGDSTNVGTTYSDTRQVNVHVTAISPIGVKKDFEQSRWSKAFRPANLTRY